jgi:multiple sugar transport system ATP-binding protein
MASIRTVELTKEYPGGVRGVDQMTLEIVDGEFFALLGPSGSGKTTLLRTIAGLEAPTGGQLFIGDRDVTHVDPGRRNVAMVFQDYALFPHMSTLDNIAYPMKVKKVAREERHRKATETAEALSLGGLMGRRPSQLSGGQQQRVALARAVASDPDVFLFDEPLSNLDARLRLEARTFLKQLQHRLGVTTVFVTHDQAEALALADRIAIMDNGRIQQVGTPREVFRTPASRFVAAFIGSVPMNLLEGRIEGGDFVFGECRLAVPPSAARTAATLAPDAQVTYGARPEYVHLDHRPSEGGVGGDVRVIENLGASLQVSIGVGDQLLRAIVDEDDGPNIGDVLYATPNPNRALLFGSDGRRIDDGDTTTAGDL